MMILANVIIELINNAWLAGVIMLALGFVFALVLLIAHEKLKVEVDPKVEQVYEALPHLDCGACGYAGCSSYAKAVIGDPELIGKCSPGGPTCSDKIASVLNLQISGGDVIYRPIVHCRAHFDDKTYYCDYHGIESCTSADALANVQACKFGCLGFGDCVKACKFGALHVVDGLATVDYEKCTGCTACSKACPRNLIEMTPFVQENMLTVACRNKELGKVTRTMCDVGCIACGLCVKQTDQFKLENNLAHLDYKNYKPDEKTQTAHDKCPTGVIVFRGKTAPTDKPSKKKQKAATVS